MGCESLTVFEVFRYRLIIQPMLQDAYHRLNPGGTSTKLHIFLGLELVEILTPRGVSGTLGLAPVRRRIDGGTQPNHRLLSSVFVFRRKCEALLILHIMASYPASMSETNQVDPGLQVVTYLGSYMVYTGAPIRVWYTKSRVTQAWIQTGLQVCNTITFMHDERREFLVPSGRSAILP